MKKRYETFTITQKDNWFDVHNEDDLLAKVPNEEEARRVIWIHCGKGEPITDEMMENVE